jgi:hypothetical protein
MTDAEMVEQFSGMLIVVDEVQNIRGGEESEHDAYKKVYNQLKRLFHSQADLKVMLLTGTPIKNDPTELAELVNLLLPHSLPPWSTDVLWWKKTINDVSVQRELERNLQGLISFVGASQQEVPKIMMGSPHPPDFNNNAFQTTMSAHQTQGYIAATHSTSNSDQHSFFIHVRQATLFVFPDGSCGRTGFNTFVEPVERRKMKDGKIVKSMHFKLNDALTRLIKNINVQTMIEAVRQFSCKYAAVLERIENCRGNVFVYITLVNGSGAILFCLLLELILGFTRSYGRESTKRNRYILLSSKTDTNVLIEAFNQKDNVHGEYIKVAVGTKAVSEGITLKNVVEEHIVSPFWNMGDTHQAEARGWRFNSHRDLLDLGEFPVVKVFHHVAIPAAATECIDLHMMKVAQEKHTLNAHLETMLKKAAFENFPLHPLPVKGHPSVPEGAWEYYIKERFENEKSVNCFSDKLTNFQSAQMQKPWHFVDDDTHEEFRQVSSLETCVQKLRLNFNSVRMDRIKRAILSMKTFMIGAKGENVRRSVVLTEWPELPETIKSECIRHCVRESSRPTALILGLASFLPEISLQHGFCRLFENTFYLADGTTTNDDTEREALWQRMQHPLSPIGHIGLYNPILDEFCLKKSTLSSASAADLRLKMTGKKCIDWDFKDLLWILLSAKILNWQAYDKNQWVWITSKEQALSMISSVKAGQKFLQTYGSMLESKLNSNLELWNRLSFLTVNVRQMTCDILFEWLCENKLMFEDLNCGHQNKKRN